MSVIKDGLDLPMDKTGKIEIPNCKRRQLPIFFREMGYKVGVEIGVYKGEFTKYLVKEGAKIYGIDPWLEYADYNYNNSEDAYLQPRQDVIYGEAIKRLTPHSNCEIIRKTSMEALKDFKDNSLDFVYIDGHHGFKWVAEDIYWWSKKVKKGGIISGHDYSLKRNKTGFNILQAIFVVDAYVKAFRIEKFYVLGRNKFIKGEIRDKNRSWMWINP